MLDRSARLDGLNLEGGTDVAKHRGPKGKRLGVVLLPSLIFGSEVKSTGVLEIGRQNNGLVSGLAGKLNAKIPRVEGDENKVEVLGRKVFVGKRIEAVNRIPERSGISYMFPGQGC